jgi:hypothetical protein
MYHPCRALAVPDGRLANRVALLDLPDAFASQGRCATAEQYASAERLDQDHVAWCKDVFLPPAE